MAQSYFKIDPDSKPVKASELTVPMNTTLRLRKENYTVIQINPEATEEPSAPDESFETKTIIKPSLFKKLHLLNEGHCNERFEIVEKLGEGASGRVYSVKDHNCDRQVAVKVLKRENDSHTSIDSIERFVREASVASNLEHPNIIPVYDLDADDSGRLYLTMRKVKGTTLREFITRRQKGSEHALINDTDDIIRVFMKLCDALSFAHSKGLTHQDVKPDNIMIGEFGEVFLIDWGASSCGEDEIALTPAYMSPQQANAEEPSPQDDVYCLGATMFHSVFLRLPTLAKDMEELWDKKRKGNLDPLSEKERKLIPPQLQSILLKALSPSKEERYQSIAEFTEDLKNYQAGQAVSAYKDSFIDFLTRWYKKNKHTFWATFLVLITLSTAGTFLYQSRLKEKAYWRKPIYTCTFDDDSWREDWIHLRGKFVRKKNRLVTCGGKSNQLIFRRKLNGPTAIEYEGEMIPGHPECDLSIVWCSDATFSEDGTELLEVDVEYRLQIGAFDNNYAMIQKDRYRADHSSFKLTPGKRYNIRMEIDGNTISIIVDGNVICTYSELFPPSSGYIGLYGFYEGKAFDNIKIYSKGVAEKVPVTMIGDAALSEGNYEKALSHYRKVADSHPGKNIGEEATYKIALCHYFLENTEEACRLWKSIKSEKFKPKATFYLLKNELENENFDAVLTGIEKMAGLDNESRKLALMLIAETISKFLSSARLEKANQLVDFHDMYFPNEHIIDNVIFNVLKYQGKYTEILDRFPGNYTKCGFALYSLQRYEELLENYPQARFACARSLVLTGRIKELITSYPEQIESISSRLVTYGYLGEVLNYFPENRYLQAKKLSSECNWEEVISNYSDVESLYADALQETGQYKKLLSEFGKDHQYVKRFLLMQGNTDPELKNHPWDKALAYLNNNQLDEVVDSFFSDELYFYIALIKQGRLEQARRLANHHKGAQVYLNILDGTPEESWNTFGKDITDNALSLLYMKEFDLLKICFPGDATALNQADYLTYFNNPSEPLRQHLRRTKLSSNNRNHFPHHIILKGILESLESGNSSSATIQLKKIAGTPLYRKIAVQRTYYNAAYILDEISAEQYINQPHKLYSRENERFYRGIKHELNGENAEALTSYIDYLQLPAYSRELNPVLDEFCKWRIRELKH